MDIGKRQVFVGSSSEGRKLAELIIAKLQSAGLHPLPWFDFFKHDRPPIQELEQLTLRASGAVLVATSDDAAIIRHQQWTQARDNVLFEYGLFSGALGRSKCGLLIPDREDFRIPSDFLGVACFSHYTEANASEAATALAASLGSVLSKPPMPETLQSRSRRLLCLISWVRDQTWSFLGDWDRDSTRDIVSARLKAVSGFLEQDIDALHLRSEYDALERLVIEAVESFPAIRRPGFENHLQRALDGLLLGRYSADPKVLSYLAHSDRYFPNDSELCSRCEYFWRERGYPRYPGPFERYPFSWETRHGIVHPLWAIGVAEATRAFEHMMYEIDLLSPLRDWMRAQLPPLNAAVVAFERRLHEGIFGPLDASRIPS
jgi:hypothetical protein